MGAVARRLELADIPIDDRLYMAARNLVDALAVVDPTKSNPQVMPWPKSANKMVSWWSWIFTRGSLSFTT